MNHEGKAVAYANAGRIRAHLRDSEMDLARISNLQDNIVLLREGIIARRISLINELDYLKAQIETTAE